MASILPFTRDKSDFDDETTRLMGEAFDAACKGLRDTGQPSVVQEVIAKRIIKAAMKGGIRSLARCWTSRFGIRPGSDLGAGRSGAADHKSRQKNGSFLREKPRISWGLPAFQNPGKAFGAGYDHSGRCEALGNLGY